MPETIDEPQRRHGAAARAVLITYMRSDCGAPARYSPNVLGSLRAYISQGEEYEATKLRTIHHSPSVIIMLLYFFPFQTWPPPITPEGKLVASFSRSAQ